MTKPGNVVCHETKYIAIWVVLLSLLLEAVFALLQKWDYTVLLGNLLSGSFSVLNFFWMGITVEKAVSKEKKEAKETLRTSQAIRTFVIFLVAAIGVWLPIFHTWSVLIPLFFPRIAIAFHPLFGKNK